MTSKAQNWYHLIGSNFFIVFDELRLKFTFRVVSINYFSFFFYKYFVLRLLLSSFRWSTLSSSSYISLSYFFLAIFSEFSATVFFSASSLRLFSLTSMCSRSKWLLMISFMVKGFLTYLLGSWSLILLMLSSLFFWILFSLNYSKERGFSPVFLHFSTYCFSISMICCFLL